MNRRTDRGPDVNDLGVDFWVDALDARLEMSCESCCCLCGCGGESEGGKGGDGGNNGIVINLGGGDDD